MTAEASGGIAPTSALPPPPAPVGEVAPTDAAKTDDGESGAMPHAGEGGALAADEGSVAQKEAPAPALDTDTVSPSDSPAVPWKDGNHKMLSHDFVSASPTVSPTASPSVSQSMMLGDVERSASFASVATIGSIAATVSAWWPFQSWSRRRLLYSVLGCFSSIVVLVFRLQLDGNYSTAYLIHSLVVFIDMILIHAFTNCLWLSIAGEATTILFVLLFYFTKETVYELMETTFLAVLCSFHLISSRNKHMNHEEALEADLEEMRVQRRALLRSGSLPPDLELGVRGEDVDDDGAVGGDVNKEKVSLQSWLFTPNFPPVGAIKGCGAHFFEHFLDGSAGVMYTSFLGLIIDEFLTYGKKY